MRKVRLMLDYSDLMVLIQALEAYERPLKARGTECSRHKLQGVAYLRNELMRALNRIPRYLTPPEDQGP